MLPTFLLLAAQTAPDLPVFRAPAGDLPTKVVPGGMTVLPNGRFVTPAGERLYTGEDLWHVALSPNGDIAVGFHRDGFTSFAGLRSGTVVRRPKSLKGLAPCGRFTIDSRYLVVSLGDQGGVVVLDTGGWEEVRRIPLNVDGVDDSYLNDFVLSVDGRFAYGVDIANGHLVTIDLRAGKVLSRVKTGRQPYAIAQSEDGQHLYVANIGLFDYALAPSGAKKPPFGYPSPEAEKALGSPNAPEGQSVWMYKVSDGRPALAKASKTGTRIDGKEVIGGSAPSALLVRGGRLFVANANDDSVQVFDAQSLKPLVTWPLAPHAGLSRLRGVTPGPMALSGDGKRLYVCESGLNSLAVLDTATGKPSGRIPTAWYPTAVKIDEVGGRLFVASLKGLGQGPRGRLNPRSDLDERQNAGAMPGMVQVVKLPTPTELAAHTQAVIRNNGLMPLVGDKPAFPAAIKHVVLITKGSHSFDAVFGGLPGVKGQAEYAEFGAQGWLREKGRRERVPVMINHLRLAERFAIGDNYYLELRSSEEARRYLPGAYPTLWSTRILTPGWEFRPKSSAKGRMAAFPAPFPEDYPKRGGLWEHLARNEIAFRNFGDGYFLGKDGIDVPMPEALYRNTDFEYPTEDPEVADVARVAALEKALPKTLPRFLNVALRNDRVAPASPEKGFPYVASYQADNDLALGRLVDHLSHLPEWKTMAIFVTETSAGEDDDHVDRHRSFVLCISPYAKRGYVSKRHTDATSVVRSIYALLGLGPGNLYDALATPLDDMFTDKPDFAPYTHLPSDPRVYKSKVP